MGRFDDRGRRPASLDELSNIFPQRHPRRARAVALGLVVLAFLFAGPALFAADESEEPVSTPSASYDYCGEAIELPLSGDLGWVVVDAQGDASEVATRVVARVAARRGELAPELEATASPRAWFLRFSSRSAETRVAFLDDLAEEAAVEWASPVYNYGETRIATRPEICLRLADDVASASVRTRLLRAGYEVLPGLDRLPRLLVVQPRDAAPPSRAFERARTLAEWPEIVGAHPAFLYRTQPHSEPSDPWFPSQWGHDNDGQYGGLPGADVHTPDAWLLTTGSPTIRIAVLDDGVDLTHPDLLPNLDGGHDATDEAPPTGVPGSPRPEDYHGTACAGLAAAVGDNSLGVAGTAWNCRIVPVRVGYGTLFTQSLWVADAITWAADHADVISASWGGLPPTPTQSLALEYAADFGRGGLGCPVVFSAGNSGAVQYPAAYPSTIAVGASSPCDERKSALSCDGVSSWASAVGPALDLVAPGIWLPTTDNVGVAGQNPTDTLPSFNGTSAACPLVAGAAALLLSLNPGLTAEEVRARLHETADDEVGLPFEDTVGPDDFMGHGRLNIFQLIGSLFPVLPPVGLDCFASGDSVDLVWGIDDEAQYLAIVVLRDGAIIAVLPGDSTHFTDTAPPDGTVQYSLYGSSGGTTSPKITCEVLVANNLTDLVWAPSDTLSGGTDIVETLIEARRHPLLVTDLLSAPPLTDFDSVWVHLGVFPDRHVPTVDETALLVEYLNSGSAALYVEGGDFWFLDGSPALIDYFGVNATSDGSSDLTTIVGSGSTACDLGAFSFEYIGDAVSIDRLTPTGGAVSVLQNIAPAYSTAVFRSTPSYRTLAVSHEFGGLEPSVFSRRELISAYLLCLLGDTSEVIRAGDFVGGPGETAQHQIFATSHTPLGGYQFGLLFDPSVLQALSASVVGSDSAGVDFWSPNIDNVIGSWTLGVVVDFFPPFSGPLPPGFEFTIAKATYEVSDDAVVGSVHSLVIPQSVGSPPVEAVFSDPTGTTTTPERVGGTFTVTEPTMRMRATNAVVDAGATFSHYIVGSYHQSIVAFTTTLEFDPDLLEVQTIDVQGTPIGV
ncbi:MAG: S8 family serine peptidase, partial [Planctomycetes bacterium]|nr:S8 family serine peptidase [Planctomycetota bacterium]